LGKRKAGSWLELEKIYQYQIDSKIFEIATNQSFLGLSSLDGGDPQKSKNGF
jgi:hypothetical protein